MIALPIWITCYNLYISLYIVSLLDLGFTNESIYQQA